jgi:hypothetical protein
LEKIRKSYMLLVIQLITHLGYSRYIRGLLNYDSLCVSLINMPHAARKAKKVQKRIIRISSPADDCSKIRLKTPTKPDFLRPENGRKSLVYFLEREEIPNPQGQSKLRFSAAESFRGSPCSSQDNSNEPHTRAGKGKKNGDRGIANGMGTEYTGGVNVREKCWRCGLFLAIRVAPMASVASPGYLTMVRFRERSFRKPRMALANVSFAKINNSGYREKNKIIKGCARAGKKVYDHMSSRDAPTQGTNV